MPPGHALPSSSRWVTIGLAAPLTVLGVLMILGWVDLAHETESAVGMAGAGLVLALAVVLLLAVAGLALRSGPAAARGPRPREDVIEGERGLYFERRDRRFEVIGVGVLVVLIAWLTTMSVAGATEGVWVWLVLLGPAAYLVFVAMRIVAGWRAPSGIWVTPSRIVDEHAGHRQEMDTAKAIAMSGDAHDLLIVGGPESVRHSPMSDSRLGRRPRETSSRAMSFSVLGVAQAELLDALGVHVSVEIGGRGTAESLARGIWMQFRQKLLWRGGALIVAVIVLLLLNSR